PAQLPAPARVSAPGLPHVLALHDALPISSLPGRGGVTWRSPKRAWYWLAPCEAEAVLSAAASRARWRAARLCSTVSTSGSRMLADRKSTRLNSSHVKISYAVFCLKKKKAH